MHFSWLGIFFHSTILLWLFEEHRPTYSRSISCSPDRKTTRLLLFVIPGLSHEHRGLLREIHGSHLWVTTSPLATPEISLTSGLSQTVLLPMAVDTIFDHVNATFLAGRRSVMRSSNWIEVDEPDYMRVKGTKGERSEIDAMGDIFNANLESKTKGKKVIFYVRFDRLYASRRSASKIHKAVRDVLVFTKDVNLYFGDNSTNAVLWGEQTGPMVVWGPNVEQNLFAGAINVHDVSPLLAALLHVEVPTDSSGILPFEVLKHSRARAQAAYCNAQQLGILAISLQERLLYSEHETLNYKNFYKELKRCENSLHKSRTKTALNCSFQLCEQALKSFGIVAKSERQTSNVGKGLAIFAWMALLCSEIVLLSYDQTPHPPSWYLYLHIFFLIVLATIFTAFAIVGWHHFKFMYITASVTMFWMVARRFHIWYPILKIVTAAKALEAMFFCALLSITSIHALSSLSSAWMSFGVCVLAHVLTLPRYSMSPIVVTYAWWTLCLFFLLCISLSPCDGPSAKLVNFGGTIWLCLSGFASFWLRPLKDIGLCAFLTLIVSCAMLLQHSAITSTKFYGINYAGYLLFFSPLLPLSGERKKTNRIVHIGVSCAVGIILTSPCMEALSYLVCFLTCCLWSILEKYKSHCNPVFSFETCRRGILLSVLLVTSDRVTRIIPFADTRFLGETIFFIVSFYRQIIVLGSLLSIFFILVPSKQAQAAFTITQFIIAVASIRTAFFPIERWYEIHQFGIALVFAYYFARILGRVQKQGKENELPEVGAIVEPERL